MWILVALVMMLLGITADSHALDSVWQDHQGALQTRLVYPSQPDSAEDGIIMLGWEADLEPGWKTYWRSPGEAGLPVRLSLIRGENAQELEVLYPFPERFELFGLQTYGYSDRVILPFKVPASTGNIEILADFMVCKEVCIPFTARYTLDVDAAHAGAVGTDIRYVEWLARVPDQTGDGGAGLTITSAKVMGVVGKQKLVVDVSGSRSLSRADVLAEAGENFHFGEPVIRLLGDGTSARLVLGVMAARGAPDLRGSNIRLTFADGHGAVIDRTLALPAD